MLFAVRFEDDPARLDVRRDRMDGHLAFLKQHAEQIRVAGSLRAAPDENPHGGLWIVEADDKTDVQGLIEEDPFWIGGLRRAVHIDHLSKAFAQPVPV